MDLKTYLENNRTLNKYSFGEFVKQRRLELGIKMIDVSQQLQISLAYICDIEKGSRRAPIRVLNEIATMLNIEENQYEDFIDLAYLSHETCAPDLIQYLIASKEARLAVRCLVDNNISGEQLLEIIENSNKNLNI